MCGKDRCIYYGCDMCCWRLDPTHIPDGLAYILTRDECDCLNSTYAELCSQECRDRYETEILECTCGSSKTTHRSRGKTAK